MSKVSKIKYQHQPVSKDYPNLLTLLFMISYLLLQILRNVTNSDSNRIQIHNQLVCKQTLDHLAIGWVFICKLSDCGFRSHCCPSNFRYSTCFKQGVPWHSGNYRVKFHSETYMCHTVLLTVLGEILRIFTFFGNLDTNSNV